MKVQYRTKYVQMDDRRLAETAQLRSIPIQDRLSLRLKGRLSIFDRERLIQELVQDDLAWERIYRINN